MCRQYHVSGRVQGVFFRDSTRAKAESLGLAGYAINLPNGDVEVRLCGGTSAVEEMRRWLATGPPLAVVENVSDATVSCSRPVGFKTG